MDFDENTLVSEIFSYRQNEVKVECEFTTLMDVFADQVNTLALKLEEKQSRAEREQKIANSMQLGSFGGSIRQGGHSMSVTVDSTSQQPLLGDAGSGAAAEGTGTHRVASVNASSMTTET
mmetsp:Transcript_27145/g.33743  ORF Transcript_27145/g.33743 Transcript_27145/m.33743 type:complete len:120 (+) Transcript_27145:1022-1381(+)